MLTFGFLAKGTVGRPSFISASRTIDRHIKTAQPLGRKMGGVLMIMSLEQSWVMFLEFIVLTAIWIFY